MKIIQKEIFTFQDQDFFSPIRNKLEYAKLLAISARQLLVDYEAEGTPVAGIMQLVIDKMSRLFYSKDGKYFSIAFPFGTRIESGQVKELSTYSGKVLNNKAISAIIAILDSEDFKRSPSLIDFFIEPGSIEIAGIELLEEIFQFEPSYLRYDCDADNENGKLHPLHHIDFNYSQYSTYKLGLHDIITMEYFVNLQNIKTDCSFVID